jgi:hypothetical protein
MDVACLALVLAAAAAAAAAASVAGAEEPARALAKIECAHASEPGRVRCEVEVRAPAGVVIKWADVVVTSAPSFAQALRARVGPVDATLHEDGLWRWAIALAARTRGAGELSARVRVVSCAKDVCAPSEIEAKAPVLVGD